MTGPAGDFDWTDHDTTDLRTGPEINFGLLALLPLVGLWRGSGEGLRPGNGTGFSYRQEVQISHDGRPFLAHESRTWLVDETGAVIRQAARETGYWRPGRDEDDIELVLAMAVGIAATLTGRAGDTQWDLATDNLVLTPTATNVLAERRFYALVRDPAGTDSLFYAQELALIEGDFQPHLNARLDRVRG